MATNLRTKLPPSDILLVYDVNTATTERFLQETKAAAKEGTSANRIVEAVADVREAAERSVSDTTSTPPGFPTLDRKANVVK